MDNWEYKYNKYKNKYLKLKKSVGGDMRSERNKMFLVQDFNNSQIKPKELKSLHNNKNMFIDAKPIYEYDQIPINIDTNSPDNYQISPNCHLGQRKLLLTEIEFYTKCVDFDSDKTNLIIYAGSASGEHMPIVLKMFPTLKFILIDPNYHTIDKFKYKYIYQNIPFQEKYNISLFQKHLNIKLDKVKPGVKERLKRLKETTKILESVDFLNSDKKYNVIESAVNYHFGNKESKDVEDMDKLMKEFFDSNYKKLKDQIKNDDETRVYLVQDYMTIDLCKTFQKSLPKDSFNIYFLTDIRSTAIRKDDPHDLDYVWNYALQVMFLKLLKPTYSMLKFRPIYFSDYDDDETRAFKTFYEKGETIFKKEYPNQTSLATMFGIIKGDLEFVKKNYGVDMFKDYVDKKLYYFDSNFILIQAWTPFRSKEARLFISEKNIDKKFKFIDEEEWAEKYYNVKFLRMFAYYPIFYEQIKKLLHEYKLDYDGCFDCTRELMILGNYLLKPSNKKVVKEIDIQKIGDLLKTQENIEKIKDIYELIKKYTTFDLSNNNYKCSFHPHTVKNTSNFIINYISDNFEYVYGLELNKYDKISPRDIIYFYKIPPFVIKGPEDKRDQKVNDNILRNYKIADDPNTKWKILYYKR